MYNINAEILSIENPLEDYYSIKLKPLEEFKWIAGQFVIVRMPDSKINNSDKRTFSIASCEKEGIVLIGTRTGKNISDFKKELLSKKVGETVNIQGPMGKFVKRDEISTMVIIVGGIGITPARAIIKDLENEENVELNIIYSAKVYHMYSEELEKICNNNKNISLYLTSNSKETDEELDMLVEKYKNDGYYYISGTQEMVNGIKSKLLENEIEKERIISDMMIGY